MNNQSYLLLCFGKKYINHAKDLVDTLRHFKDNRPINSVVSPEDYDYATSLKLFDKVITYDVTKHHLYSICITNFEKYGLLPRLELYKFVNTDYTMVLDVDILCAYNTDTLWEYLLNKNQTLVMIGSKNNTSWHWGKWGEVCKKNNIKPQETHGGLFFIDNRNPKILKQIFQDAEYCFLNYDQLGLLRYYQGGTVDEPCFAYAFSKNNLIPVEFSEFPSITFNLQAIVDDIPTKNMTESQQNRIMSNYIPFIHMFEKNDTINFKLLKQKILNYES